MQHHVILKKDNWNMILVDVKGTKIEVREISTEWGEEKHVFHSRPELMNWVHSHYRAVDYVGQEEEYEQIIENFSKV
ncbi:hypothetical protein [Ammoniphilus resinae]|uniref:Uncharacterized protein n=1 Tax=Ammoniphilus resinae TaxID=861532 RepID=A0ABS4GU50_9BACL|nr:hypothetical protein [Ammoniphilus resinae]MBP1933776.1 hypothetical protein [Ammoniphilus resinae]